MAGQCVLCLEENTRETYARDASNTFKGGGVPTTTLVHHLNTQTRVGDRRGGRNGECLTVDAILKYFKYFKFIETDVTKDLHGCLF